MTYLLTFIVVWFIFIRFADKKQFRTLYPTALVAMIMSLTSDIVTQFNPLWTYQDSDTHFPQLLILLLDDFGIYPVIAMLYVQRLPNTFKKWAPYTFFWTGIGIGLEYILASEGYYGLHRGWSIAWSYIADWIIFTILTAHHRWAEKTKVF